MSKDCDILVHKLGCRIYLSFVKTPRLAEFKNTSFPLGCSPYAPSPCLLLCTNLQILRIIYKAVGDLLPADASVRIKPEKGGKLLSESWLLSVFISIFAFLAQCLGWELGGVLGFLGFCCCCHVWFF